MPTHPLHRVMACAAALYCLCIAGPALAEDFSFKGELDKTDAKLDSDEYHEEHQIRATAGQLVELTMDSEAFDTYLIVYPPDADEDESFENDDQSDFNFNAKVSFIAPKTGVYTVVATSSDSEETGRYKITGSTQNTAIEKAEQGTLSIDDQMDLKTGEYLDTFKIELGKGEKRVIIVNAENFDAYLVVHTPDRHLLTADDPPILVVEGGDKGGVYTIVVTSFEPGETGKYSLQVRTIGAKPLAAAEDGPPDAS